MRTDSTNFFLQRLCRAWSNLFWLGLWLLSLGLLLLYPVRWLSGDYFKVVRLINYIIPWLPILLLMAIIIAGLARRTWLAMMLATPALLIGFTFAPLFVAHSRAATRTDDFSIKIMSHNLFGHQNAKALADVIRLEQPDIVLLQEYNAAITPTLLYELAGLYPGDQVYIDVVHSQATLSRYPITHTDVAWDKGRVQKIVVETPAGSMAVWNVHFYPPFMYPTQVHDRQVDALVVDIAAMDQPLIVAGDFNVTGQSATYRLINHYLHNAHRSAGWGLGFTFPARPHTKGLPLATGPIYRIDHVFYNHHFVAYHARTLTTSAGSDHLPIVAELSLAE